MTVSDDSGSTPGALWSQPVSPARTSPWRAVVAAWVRARGQGSTGRSTGSWVSSLPLGWSSRTSLGSCQRPASAPGTSAARTPDATRGRVVTLFDEADDASGSTTSPTPSRADPAGEGASRTTAVSWVPSSGAWPNAGMGSHIEFWTLNASESPSGAVESSLSDVLETTGEHLHGYSLSPKACQGILRRASRRGRSLAPPARGGAGAGGRETAVTLMARDRPAFDPDMENYAIGVLGDTAHTLTAEGHDASEDGTGRGTPVVYQQHGSNVGELGTLRVGNASHTGGVPFMVAPETAATLTAGQSSPGVSAPGRRQEDDHSIVAFAGQTGGHVDMPVGDVAPTLNTAQIHSVAYAAEQTSTLQAAGGDRGYRVDAEGAAGGHLVATFQKVIRSGARDAEGGLPPEVWAERDVAATLNLNDLGSESRAVEVAVHLHSPGLTVRRLTPLECARLQGMPDDHLDTSWGKPQADSPKYKQCGNSVAVPVFAWVAHRMVAVHAQAVAA